MIPRLGDGNLQNSTLLAVAAGLEIDSPSRGRKLRDPEVVILDEASLEIDSPSRGRKPQPDGGVGVQKVLRFRN